MKKKGKRSGNRGCMFLVFGTLCVLVGMMIYIFLVGRLTSTVVEARYGGQAAYAIMTAQLPCILVAFLLMEAVLILQYLPSEEEYQEKLKDRSQPVGKQKKHILGTRKVTNIISLVLLLCLPLCGAISINTYRLVSEDGMTEHCFVDQSVYTWENVQSYRVDCDSDKGLSVTFTMEDGKQLEILQGTVSDTQAFANAYSSTTAFAAHMGERLDSLQIPRNVSHMERAVKFYRDKYPTLWPYVKALTGYEEIDPWEDELAPESQTGEVSQEHTSHIH